MAEVSLITKVVTDHEELEVYLFATEKGKNLIAAYNNRIGGCIQISYWLSDPICLQLKQLNDILLRMSNEYDPEIHDLFAMWYIASSFKTQIEAIVKEIKIAFFKDLCELDNFERYIQKKAL